MKRMLLGTAAALGVLAALPGGAAAAQGSAAGQRVFEVFFDFDKSDLTAAALKVIQQAADSAKAGNLTEITVTGHTDTVGTAAYNQALSERRAAAVKAQLVTDGVPAGSISATGVGKTGLLVQTADGVREPQNRRAEIAGAAPAEVAAAAPPPPPPPPAQAGCTGEVDPYKNYACMDKYLGSGFFERFYNYYRLEWGEGGPPTDPNAPSPHREGWPETPETTPPMAFTEWPTGALTSIGVTRPNGADSPLMVALGDEGLGAWLQEANTQIYGWIDPGFNISSNSVRPGGNAPLAYTYTPNTVQLDQAVLYIDRWPDTVQTDHFDWGFRLSGIYGENYRYTNSYGIASFQFNKHNQVNGYDFPMEYIDLWFPWIFEGLEVRAGRYISIPDIEAQLAPNNILYTHSLTYAWDNYTNTGIVFSTQVNKNILVQLGLTDGTETPIWHTGTTLRNLVPVITPAIAAANGLSYVGPNPLYPSGSFYKDPGNQASYTACVRFVWNNGDDTVYPCFDGINNGAWGYNNIQWHGFTYYHKFDDHWSIDYENYYLQENHVPNIRNPVSTYLVGNGGTPLGPPYIPLNGPNLAYCKNAQAFSCNAWAIGVLSYINYTVDPLNNLTFRPEWYYDPQGWRTGTGAYSEYWEASIGWQHWLSPQIEFRPEVSYWRSTHTDAFNQGNPTGCAVDHDYCPKNFTVMGAMDVIIHF